MALIDTERTARHGGDKETALRDWVRALEATAAIAASPQRTLQCVIEELAQTCEPAAALIAERESLSYGALARRTARYARWALHQGIEKGEVVCLLMPNRPEYMAVWLGLSSVGVVVSLINTQLRGPALSHCIDIAAPKHLIVAAELFDEFRSAVQLASDPIIWMHGEFEEAGLGHGCSGGAEYERIDLAVEHFAGERLTTSERRGVTIADRALLIYTSGTTGLPKAANVSHRRVLQWSFWFAGLMNTGPDDRMYDCLPMYHSVGGVVATGALLVRGGSVFLRERFSAQRFWDDIVAQDCTLFQYIGELARYLVNAPGHAREREHGLRMCCGNGLRGDVWEKFQARFAIPRVLEFYAATEGNVSLYNVEGKVGAIGRVPPFLRHRFGLTLVKFDPETEMPARDASGFCVRCAIDETGEAIGRIRNGPLHSAGEFEGYTNEAESERKILRNVFEPGDAWYRTGDLMRADASGFFYFVDRIGDTFRWKGENVATSEVAEAMMAFPGTAEATVYGVSIPGADGAAGMAALVVTGAFDLPGLRKHLVRRLPAYARPLFLRVMDGLKVTATFKHAKNDLRRESYDPAATSDKIYFDDAAAQAYVPLDAAGYERIRTGKTRL